MNSITRSITVHKYTFANIDLQTGQAVNMHTIEKTFPMTQYDIKEYCKDHDNCLCIHHGTDSRKYTLPLERFIAACEAYTGVPITTTEKEN